MGLNSNLSSFPPLLAPSFTWLDLRFHSYKMEIIASLGCCSEQYKFFDIVAKHPETAAIFCLSCIFSSESFFLPSVAQRESQGEKLVEEQEHMIRPNGGQENSPRAALSKT